MARPRDSQATRNPPAEGIASLWVEGYKSLIDRQELEVRPLTVLAGSNSSGKSSIMQPLLLLKQTVEAPYDPGPLQLDGTNVSVTEIEQVLARKGKTGAPASRFTIGLRLHGLGSVASDFGKAGGQVQLFETRLEEPAGGLRLTDGMPIDAVEGQAQQFLRDLQGLGNGHSEPMWELEVRRDRCFITPIATLTHDRPRQAGRLGVPLSRAVIAATKCISDVIHLPALRGNPKRAYPAVAVGDAFPGTFESYTAGVIRAWQHQASTTLHQLRSELEHLGLTWKVEARQIDDAHVELVVGRLPRALRGGAKDLVNIVDVGFGVSQTLPVVVALLVARPGQLVYLEQPEIHLHPRAQSRLAAVIGRAATRGVRVVVETHSSLVIRGIQTLVARGELSEELVALHWFTRSPTTGATTIRSGQLDRAGAFGDWPEDFDEVLLESERDYLDAAEQRAPSQP